MRISSSSDLTNVRSTAAIEATEAATAQRATARRYGVLNDFRYLTETDSQLLRAATGEALEAKEPSSQFAQQLALDRRTGELAPHQDVTAVYLRNAAARIDEQNAGRKGFTNPYSGPAMDKAVSYLESIGRGRADIRL
ncbi:MAG: hypothetical protein Q4G51_03575 [Dermatophilus congolensis]|nr:hypothetical protein [Dermatophilus congolensis]